MDLSLILGKKEEIKVKKRKPGRPKSVRTKRHWILAADKLKAKKDFAFDWCYRNNFELVGIANEHFFFRDKIKTWLVYEKPYDEETPYIPSEVPVTHVNDY